MEVSRPTTEKKTEKVTSSCKTCKANKPWGKRRNLYSQASRLWPNSTTRKLLRSLHQSGECPGQGINTAPKQVTCACQCLRCNSLEWPAVCIRVGSIRLVWLLPPKQVKRFMLKTTCVLKVAILFELKLFTKTQRHTSWNWYKLFFPAVGFCSKDHSWEILYKIKIGLDSEKYSTVLISNWQYLQSYLQWKKRLL